MHRSVSELITTRRPRFALSSLIAIALFIILGAQTNANAAGQNGSGQTTQDKLDSELTARVKSGHPLRTTGVIVTLAPGAVLPPEFQRFAHPGKLDIINGHVLDLPDSLLTQVAAHPNVFKLHYDRPVATHNYRTAMTVGARKVNQTLGYTGAGIGVAVIDTGITSWHDDLTNTSSTTYPYGNQRVAKFVDFVNGQSLPYDDSGHGSHVSGTILGNGYDSNGDKAGMAPGASLVSLKVLDANGQGRISTVIKALDWVATHDKTYNIRVVNVSVGAGVFESYLTDPLTLATKALVDKGITVVAAAGNFGENAEGQPQWGGITAPGNAPWVLTVCASSTMGTITRDDDQLAPYSSAGPTAFDFLAKPDLCAPGSGTISLAVPGSTFYETKSAYLADGSLSLGYKPYLSLTGTSMAAPVVSGTVALMLQANPSLTPNLIKAILQYTAQVYPGYSPLQQGAGFLDSYGAVQLARFYAQNKVGTPMPIESTWSQRIVWGNYLLTGGYLNPRGSAWANNIVWGTSSRDNIVWGTGPGGVGRNNIVWGTACGHSCQNIVWSAADANFDNIVWGTSGHNNIVWGTNGRNNIVWGTGGRQNIVWGTDFLDNIVWGTDFLDNIVWGTDFLDNIVWGTDFLDNIVWGTDFLDNIVWGTDFLDNIVWGTSCQGANCPNVVWGAYDALDNIVWGTAKIGDNIVWGTNGLDNIVWGTDSLDNIVWGTSSRNDVTWGNSPEAVLFPDDSILTPNTASSSTPTTKGPGGR